MKTIAENANDFVHALRRGHPAHARRSRGDRPTGIGYGVQGEPCGVYGKVTFEAVKKPSDAVGFFTIGVSATKE